MDFKIKPHLHNQTFQEQTRINLMENLVPKGMQEQLPNAYENQIKSKFDEIISKLDSLREQLFLMT